MRRREFIAKSALAYAALNVPKLFSFSNTEKKLLIGNPLRFPPQLQPGEPLVLNLANVEVWPGTTTQVNALNNSYPGPSIKIQKGEQFSVLFENQLSEDATIHWHGLRISELMDGQPKDPVLPGQNYTYTFPVFQKAGTFFYHAHAHHLTAKQVYKGLAGFFIIEDEDEIQFGLPTGEYDVPLVIQDRHSAYQPQFNYAPSMMDRMIGYLGDLPLINGTPDAYFEVQRTLYRFRILNGSNARVYKIAFSDNSNFWILSTDGGIKDEVVPANNFFLSPGERVEILFDFSGYTLGNSVSLVSQPFTGVGNQGTAMNLLRFDVIGNNSSGGQIPSTLPPIIYYNINDIQRTRNFTLTQSGMGTGMHRINGLTYDMNRIDEIIPFNELEEWRFINNTNNFHPMHVHGVLFQVYSRNENTNLLPNDKGWKDTVLVNPNETVSMLAKFSDYSGQYLLHCHNLEHENDGMMLNIKIDNPTVIDEGTGSPDNFELYQNYPNPFNPNTTIKYKLEKPDNYVRLSIFNTNGELVENLFEGSQSSGIHSVTWDASKFSTGTYYFRMEVEGIIKTIKLIYLK